MPWLVTGWEGSPAGWDAADVLGALAGLIGLAMVIACFARFVREGRGTPAPPAPTDELVVGGLAIAGQCLVFRSLLLVVWLALFTVAVVPRLRRRRTSLGSRP